MSEDSGPARKRLRSDLWSSATLAEGMMSVGAQGFVHGSMVKQEAETDLTMIMEYKVPS